MIQHWIREALLSFQKFIRSWDLNDLKLDKRGGMIKGLLGFKRALQTDGKTVLAYIEHSRQYDRPYTSN